LPGAQQQGVVTAYSPVHIWLAGQRFIVTDDWARAPKRKRERRNTFIAEKEMGHGTKIKTVGNSS